MHTDRDAMNCSLRTDALSYQPLLSPSGWIQLLLLWTSESRSSCSLKLASPLGDRKETVQEELDEKQNEGKHGIEFSWRRQIAKRIFWSAGATVQKEGSHIVAWEQMAI